MRAAFEFMRQRRGQRFAETVAEAVFPTETVRDFLGIDEFQRDDDAEASTHPVLPPAMVEILAGGTANEIVDALKREPTMVEAAFAFLQDHRNAGVVQRVLDDLHPEDGDWTGMRERVREHLGGPAARARQLHLDADLCNAEPPETDEEHAFRGIQLHLTFDAQLLDEVDRMPHPHQFGPGDAGPYKLIPCTRRGLLLGYIARHRKREQNEWVLGPESADAFAAAASMYAGAAASLLPGAPAVPESMLDGADQPRTPDSVVEAAARGEAPWQHEGAMDKMDGSGGPALVAAANGAIRIGNYVIPAKVLAARVEADVRAGKIHHLVGRSLAVEQRNDLLVDTRRKISPSSLAISKRLKEDGKTLADLEARKTEELLQKYRDGTVRRGKRIHALSADEHAQVRARLDADSPVWAQYTKALEAGGDPAVFRQQLAELGRSKAVSTEIIRSAGRPRGWVTGVAAFGLAAGGVVGAINAEESIYNIVDAADGEKLHAAARELAGFAGGVLAAEGAVWIASALVGASVGPFGLFVVSTLAGVAGGAAGSHAAISAVDLLAEASLAGIMPATAFSARGGLAGVHSSDEPHGRNLGQQLADRIFNLDAELAKYDRSIRVARDAGELDRFRKGRLEILARRAQLEDALVAIRLGAFEDHDNASHGSDDGAEVDASTTVNASTVEPPPTIPIDLLCDDDCDDTFD
jgi:hypothetical protein